MGTGVLILEYSDIADTSICTLIESFFTCYLRPTFPTLGRLTVDIYCRVHITTYE